MRIYCCECGDTVDALLIDGKEVYPHRNDLHKLPFWKCEQCKNFVGCHHKTKDRTKPLGCIPTPEIKKARQQIHRILDPIWQSGSMDRNDLYRLISSKIGKTYHTAEIRSIEEAREVYRIVRLLAAEQAIGVIGGGRG